MSCRWDKEVLFFEADSRDTSQLLYLLLTVHKHDLLGEEWDTELYLLMTLAFPLPSGFAH
jgi:hypothetical protein